jgi:hypothetical protein
MIDECRNVPIVKIPRFNSRYLRIENVKRIQSHRLMMAHLCHVSVVMTQRFLDVAIPLDRIKYVLVMPFGGVHVMLLKKVMPRVRGSEIKKKGSAPR